MPLAERLALPLMLSGGAGEGEPGESRLALIEIAGLQGRIGLVDDLESFLGCFVAAMRVRMVLLDEDFIPCLEPQRGKWRFEIENSKRLLPCREGTRMRFTGAPAAFGIGTAVGTVSVARIELERVADPGARAMPLAEFPA